MNEAKKVEVEFGVMAEMRDGVVLRADVYRPVGDDSWPTMLVRTPYGKNTLINADMVDPVKTARAGFVVVIQDTRGRSSSDGEWVPFATDVDDGYDSVEWAARLPGSNGQVGMLGESYSGWVQWAAASAKPSALKAIAPALTWREPADGLYERGGVPELGLKLWWALFVGFDYLSRLGLSEDEEMARVVALVEECDQLFDLGYWQLPDPERQTLVKHGIPGMAEENAPAVTASHPDTQIPSLNVGGWYDLFLQGTIDNFTESAPGHPDTRLLIGPWSHESFFDPLGEAEHGLLSYRREVPTTEAGDIEDFTRMFLHSHLAEDGTALASKPVRYFTMGVNEWREADSWPPPGVSPERYYLCDGSGLSPELPSGDGTAATFSYDPADPVPTRGGNILMSPRHRTGVFDQSDLEARDDVLAFTSEPLPQPVEVTGRVKAFIHATSSAPSTDWVVRLCDVYPDGRSMNICDGIVRATAADSPNRYEVDLWSTSYVFLPGHRIRVDVTSSSFPRWERNLNTGDQQSSDMEVAHQTIHLDADDPSFIELPMVTAQ